MATSNAPATAIIGACRVAAMTDVTGFGLARHALNLAARCGFSGIHLRLDDIPFLNGAAQLSASGIASSLKDGNMRAVPDQHLAPNLAPEKISILFDPQTSGGVLAAIPSQDAKTVIAALTSPECSLVARIGSFTTSPGLALS
jgi:selenide,water dikinase